MISLKLFEHKDKAPLMCSFMSTSVLTFSRLSSHCTEARHRANFEG
jgi:hypothetical protein